MICPKCGIYNPYGRQECAECGHAFVEKPIELSRDSEEAEIQRRTQPYYYTAKVEPEEPKPRKEYPRLEAMRDKAVEFHGKSKSVIEYVSAFAAFLYREIIKNKRLVRVILAVLALGVLIMMISCISCAGSCIAEEQKRREEEAALAASLADAAAVDPTPSIVSMSDVWILNQYNTKMTLRRDGSFTTDQGSGTWSYDIDKIYLVYEDGTLKNYTYRLQGDYLFLDWKEMTLTRNCNASESVPIAGLWISGDGFAVAINEDGTHGAGDDEYGKYANAWAYENDILAMVTIRNNVEYFDYFICQLDGETMLRTSGSVYIREGGGIALGGGEIETSTGYDPNA